MNGYSGNAQFLSYNIQRVCKRGGQSRDQPISTAGLAFEYGSAAYGVSRAIGEAFVGEMTQLPKKDIARTIAGEIVVSDRFKEASEQLGFERSRIIAY